MLVKVLFLPTLTVERFLQFSKADSPILFTELGMLIYVNFSIPLNADFPMLTMVLGSSTLRIFKCPLNALSAMPVTVYV